VWGSEFTKKAATLQDGHSAEIAAGPKIDLCDLTACAASSHLEQPSPVRSRTSVGNTKIQIPRFFCRWPRGGPRRDNVRNRTEHTATLLPTAYLLLLVRRAGHKHAGVAAPAPQFV
jgi:hypothetical protein